MYSKSNNKKYVSYNDANEVVEELIESLHSRYQGNLGHSMRGSEFIFDSVQLMYYKYYQENVKCSGSYIDSPDCIEKKKATVNSKNKDKCFHYAIMVALKYEKITWKPERISNIKLFINKYKGKVIIYPSKIDNWKAFVKNNLTSS